MQSLPTRLEAEPPERAAARSLPPPRAPGSGALGFGAPFDGEDEGDLRLAEIAGVALHKRHVYDRLLEVDPQRLREIEESLLLDAKVRVVAAELGVRVEDGELDFEVKREWARVERAFARDALGLPSVEAYVERVYGMGEAGFRAHVRRLAWRRKMRAYAIRFAQLRRGVVRMQRFVAQTREAAAEARRAVADGADFGRVASQASTGPRARRGGRMPALLRGMPHAALAHAEGVEVGALSPVRARDDEGGFAFVRVLERSEPSAASFEASRVALRRELERRPITRDELLVFHAAYAASDAPAKAPVDAPVDAPVAGQSRESAVSSERRAR